MIRALVSVDKDLASSIALRYACQMSISFDIAFQAFHVQDPGPDYNLPGTGWVRRTWETALGETGKEEIDKLLMSEKVNYRVLGLPKIQIGDKEDEILSEAQTGEYDLFMEGALSTANVKDFYRMMKSKFFRKMPLPVVLVKNLVELESVAILVNKNHDYRDIISFFSKLLKDSGLPVELIFWQADKNKELVFSDNTGFEKELDSIEKILEEYGCTCKNARVVKGPADKLAAGLKEFGLVVTGVKQKEMTMSPLLELLARTESPVMLIWQ